MCCPLAALSYFMCLFFRHGATACQFSDARLQLSIRSVREALSRRGLQEVRPGIPLPRIPCLCCDSQVPKVRLTLWPWTTKCQNDQHRTTAQQETKPTDTNTYPNRAALFDACAWYGSVVMKWCFIGVVNRMIARCEQHVRVRSSVPRWCPHGTHARVQSNVQMETRLRNI